MDWWRAISNQFRWVHSFPISSISDRQKKLGCFLITELCTCIPFGVGLPRMWMRRYGKTSYRLVSDYKVLWRDHISLVTHPADMFNLSDYPILSPYNNWTQRVLDNFNLGFQEFLKMFSPILSLFIEHIWTFNWGGLFWIWILVWWLSLNLLFGQLKVVVELFEWLVGEVRLAMMTSEFPNWKASISTCACIWSD